MVFVVIRARIIGNLAKGRERQSWIDPRPKMECDDLFFPRIWLSMPSQGGFDH